MTPINYVKYNGSRTERCVNLSRWGIVLVADVLSMSPVEAAAALKDKRFSEVAPDKLKDAQAQADKLQLQEEKPGMSAEEISAVRKHNAGEKSRRERLAQANNPENLLRVTYGEKPYSQLTEVAREIGVQFEVTTSRAELLKRIVNAELEKYRKAA